MCFNSESAETNAELETLNQTKPSLQCPAASVPPRHVLLPCWCCMRSYSAPTCRHVIYSSTAPTDAVSPKTRGNTGVNVWTAEEEIWKCIFCGERTVVSSIRMNSYVPRWNRGPCVAMWAFHWYTYLLFTLSQPVCLIYQCEPGR